MVQFAKAAVLFAASVNACTGPPVNPPTVDLITKFEGFNPNIYDDPAGKPTVGYGHLCSDASCSDVSFPIPLSDADGESLLAQDLAVSNNVSPLYHLSLDNTLTTCF